MTAQTPVYHLTYTTGTDRLCDGAAILDQLEADYATAFATVEADVDRLTVLPYAIVSAYNVVENGGVFNGVDTTEIFDIRYDAVEADTANMVDLGTAPSIIFWNPATNTKGVWMAGFSSQYLSGQVTDNFTRLIDENNALSQTNFRIGDQFLPPATPLANITNVNGLYSLATATISAAMATQFVTQFTGVAGGHIEASQPHMWMFWMRDPA